MTKVSRITVEVIESDGESYITTFPMYRDTPKKTVSFLNRQQAGMGLSTRFRLVENEQQD